MLTTTSVSHVVESLEINRAFREAMTRFAQIAHVTDRRELVMHRYNVAGTKVTFAIDEDVSLIKVQQATIELLITSNHGEGVNASASVEQMNIPQSMIKAINGALDDDAAILALPVAQRSDEAA